MKPNNVNVREVRHFAATELRTVSEDGKNYLEGYAARYNVRSSDLGWGMYEVLVPGAFTRALAEGQDVRHLVNHDPSLLIGRTKAGTTVLSEDAQGLRFKTALPDTQLARDLRVSVDRGDINECSFGFICRKATWVEEKDDKGENVSDLRQVQDVDLFDISIVTYPAYPQTNAKLAMRTMFPEGIPEEIRAKQVDPDGDDDVELDSCGCACPECQAGNCELCSSMDCDDDRCMHDYPSKNSVRKTKRVDGEDLTADAFLIVGNPDEPETWQRAIKFSTEEKTINHIKNALARFDALKGVSEGDKKVAWSKLAALAESHNIEISQEDRDKHREDADPITEAMLLAQAAHTLALRLRAMEASL